MSIGSLKEDITKAMARVKAMPLVAADPDVPAKIVAIREAARLEKLRDERQADMEARKCLGSLSSSLGKRYSRDRTLLVKFQVYHQAQKAAIAQVQAFLDDLENNLRDARSLVLYGAVGTGKDHLLAAALYLAASATIPTQWLSGQEFYGRIRDSMDTGECEENLMEKWDRPFVLGISDPIPPTGKPSEWNASQLYRILDRRYRSMRCTWASLNAVSLDDADAKLSAPSFDRLRDGATLVPCFWPSFRERKKPVP